MKILLGLFSLSFLSLVVSAQESRFTLSGGYAFGKTEDYDSNTSGYRINGLYEYNPNNGVLAHGFSFGYIHTSADVIIVLESKEIKINSFPLYYAPKLIFGGGKLKGFVKGALGMHVSSYSSTGSLAELKGSDFGVFLGLGGGVMYFFNEKVFMNIEYEWDFMNNSYYNDGFIQSAQIGLGTKF